MEYILNRLNEASTWRGVLACNRFRGQLKPRTANRDHDPGSGYNWFCWCVLW